LRHNGAKHTLRAVP